MCFVHRSSAYRNTWLSLYWYSFASFTWYPVAAVYFDQWTLGQIPGRGGSWHCRNIWKVHSTIMWVICPLLFGKRRNQFSNSLPKLTFIALPPSSFLEVSDAKIFSKFCNFCAWRTYYLWVCFFPALKEAFILWARLHEWVCMWEKSGCIFCGSMTIFMSFLCTDQSVGFVLLPVAITKLIENLFVWSYFTVVQYNDH